jgi:hypothetical protein
MYRQLSNRNTPCSSRIDVRRNECSTSTVSVVTSLSLSLWALALFSVPQQTDRRQTHTACPTPPCLIARTHT